MKKLFGYGNRFFVMNDGQTTKDNRRQTTTDDIQIETHFCHPVHANSMQKFKITILVPSLHLANILFSLYCFDSFSFLFQSSTAGIFQSSEKSCFLYRAGKFRCVKYVRSGDPNQYSRFIEFTTLSAWWNLQYLQFSHTTMLFLWSLFHTEFNFEWNYVKTVNCHFWEIVVRKLFHWPVTK